MLKLIIPSILTALLFIASSQTYAGPQYCYGRYALCAASTCEFTGREIRTKVVSSTTGLLTGYAKYPEAVCTCPILDGKFQAQGANLGQMQGTCDQPGPGLVWSMYSPIPLPQAMHSYNLSKEDQKPLVQVCAAKKDRSFTNCFGFSCKINPETVNGIQLATCYCPTNDDFYGNPVPPGTSAFKNEAGQCNSNYCGLMPASGVYSPSNAGPACLGAPPPL